MTLNKEELAARLNGREYSEEITDSEASEAKSSGLVVVFGYSDDTVEFRGAIHDEAYPNEEREVWVKPSGVVSMPEEDQEVLEKYGVLNAFMQGAKCITSIYGYGEYSWKFETKLPHACFEIMEDGEKFCRGIVFDIQSLNASEKGAA